MKHLLALGIALLVFAGWAPAPVLAQEEPSETRRFTGVYVDGWEAKLFVERGRENEQPYAVAMSPEAREAMAKIMPEALEPGEGLRVITTFDGRLSPPGRYGHLGAYPRTVLIETLISARLESRPTAYCDASVDLDWYAGEGQNLKVTVSTTGPTCRQSAALLVVRNQAGDVLWTYSASATAIGILNGPATRTPMTDALRNWIAFGLGRRTTADLPPWPESAPWPQSPSARFDPEAGIDRAAYQDLRTRAEPMFCYMDGMDSLACLALRDGALRKIGVQTYPR